MVSVSKSTFTRVAEGAGLYLISSKKDKQKFTDNQFQISSLLCSLLGLKACIFVKSQFRDENTSLELSYAIFSSFLKNL